MIGPLERVGPDDDESAEKAEGGQDCKVRIDPYRRMMRGISPSILHLTPHGNFDTGSEHAPRAPSVDEPHRLRSREVLDEESSNADGG
jgi:hypothetical protein